MATADHRGGSEAGQQDILLPASRWYSQSASSCSSCSRSSTAPHLAPSSCPSSIISAAEMLRTVIAAWFPPPVASCPITSLAPWSCKIRSNKSSCAEPGCCS
ncbi:hypothetical protein PVAP13_4KG087666 [Panicum virgatum]|uniref:Uncharacterized protein n=1 Tax=Panicum virgatum TaxID=38727 RepID=A0A8T0THT5_PANVG|nr:hypothetical protein PVAP13_4KG087666 [Panicum virgatum]